MPRRDKTFSEKDVLRIYNYYLTADERLLVRKAIIQEPVEEEGLWPEELCFPLEDILDMVQFSIYITKEIWSLSKISVGFANQLLRLAKVIGWIPIIGSLIEKNIKNISEEIWDFEAANYKRILALEIYWEKVSNYVSWNCHRR